MEVVICSGEVNRYGYRTDPKGARLEAYQANPILLYKHNLDKPSVGSVSNIHVNKQGMLVGTLEFDEGDDFALDLKRKYEKGYMKGVSMDHLPLTVSEAPEDILPGQTRVTVKEWELNEISVCNLPGDRGAVKLSSDQDLDTIVPKLKLSIQSQNQKIDIMSTEKISKALGLSADATEGAIVDEITKLTGRVAAAEKARIDTLIDSGKAAGVISDDNEESYRKLSAADYDNASKLLRLSIEKANKAASTTDNETKLTAKGIIDSVKKLNGDKTTEGDEETFEKLSKENPNRLNEIRKTDPERYAKLAAGYAPAKN